MQKWCKYMHHWLKHLNGIKEVCVYKNCSKYIRQKKNPNLSLYSLLLSFEKIGTPSGYISQNVLNYYSAMNATEEVSSEKIRLFEYWKKWAMSLIYLALHFLLFNTNRQPKKIFTCLYRSILLWLEKKTYWHKCDFFCSFLGSDYFKFCQL